MLYVCSWEKVYLEPKGKEERGREGLKEETVRGIKTGGIAQLEMNEKRKFQRKK